MESLFPFVYVNFVDAMEMNRDNSPQLEKLNRISQIEYLQCVVRILAIVIDLIAFSLSLCLTGGTGQTLAHLTSNQKPRRYLVVHKSRSPLGLVNGR